MSEESEYTYKIFFSHATGEQIQWFSDESTLRAARKAWRKYITNTYPWSGFKIKYVIDLRTGYPAEK